MPATLNSGYCRGLPTWPGGISIRNLSYRVPTTRCHLQESDTSKALTSTGMLLAIAQSLGMLSILTDYLFVFLLTALIYSISRYGECAAQCSLFVASWKPPPGNGWRLSLFRWSFGRHVRDFSSCLLVAQVVVYLNLRLLAAAIAGRNFFISTPRALRNADCIFLFHFDRIVRVDREGLTDGGESLGLRTKSRVFRSLGQQHGNIHGSR